MSAKEYKFYLEQSVLQEDYLRVGNSVWSGVDGDYIEIFIKYEDGVYIKIKDYVVDENGCLVYVE